MKAHLIDERHERELPPVEYSLSNEAPMQTGPLQARMARLPQQGPFRHLMDMKAEKRLAGWKERRSRFGDINVHKCYQFGQVFSPFQALATTVSFRLSPRGPPGTTLGSSSFSRVD
jgi:hypothetical protein